MQQAIRKILDKNFAYFVINAISRNSKVRLDCKVRQEILVV